MSSLEINNLKQLDKFASTCVEELKLSSEEKFVILLKGDMAVGKTQLVQFIAQHLGVAKGVVNSPTFSLINSYKNKNQKQIFHVDLYRLKSTKEPQKSSTKKPLKSSVTESTKEAPKSSTKEWDSRYDWHDGTFDFDRALEQIAFWDLFETPNLIFIEWPEPILNKIPPSWKKLLIEIKFKKNKNTRLIKWKKLP